MRLNGCQSPRQVPAPPEELGCKVSAVRARGQAIQGSLGVAPAAETDQSLGFGETWGEQPRV